MNPSSAIQVDDGLRESIQSCIEAYLLGDEGGNFREESRARFRNRKVFVPFNPPIFCWVLKKKKTGTEPLNRDRIKNNRIVQTSSLVAWFFFFFGISKGLVKILDMINPIFSVNENINKKSNES